MNLSTHLRCADYSFYKLNCYVFFVLCYAYWSCIFLQEMGDFILSKICAFIKVLAIVFFIKNLIDMIRSYLRLALLFGALFALCLEDHALYSG